MRDKTLLFLHRPERGELCLAMKKRGFGDGKWNGVGGKLEPGETIEQAAVRETEEEIGVRVSPSALEKRGELEFYYEPRPAWDCLVHVYLVREWTGEPVESEEMRPRWFKAEEIPFDEMWEDDRHWLPRILSGAFVRGAFRFGPDGKLAEVRWHEA